MSGWSKRDAKKRTKNTSRSPRFTWTLLLACSTYKMKLKATTACGKRHNREEKYEACVLGLGTDNLYSSEGENWEFGAHKHTERRPRFAFRSILARPHKNIFFGLALHESSLVTFMLRGLHGSQCRAWKEKNSNHFIEIPSLLHIPELLRVYSRFCSFLLRLNFASGKKLLRVNNTFVCFEWPKIIQFSWSID